VHLRPEARLSLLEQSMRVLQKHHPDQDWSVHCRLAAIIRHEARSTPSRRKTGRIVSSRLLFEKGLNLSEVARPDKPPVSLSEARNRRDGMMIAFLALIPIRRHTFCALELGRSIYLMSDQVFLSLDPTSTKNKTAYEAQIPPVLAAPLLTYLKFVRPWFLARAHKTHGLVWVTDGGKPYCPIHLASRISRITERLVCVRTPPHFFRDCAATTLAYGSPDAARLTRAILGHKTFGVAERHYNQARAIQTGRDYASILQALRKDD